MPLIWGLGTTGIALEPSHQNANSGALQRLFSCSYTVIHSLGNGSCGIVSMSVKDGALPGGDAVPVGLATCVLHIKDIVFRIYKTQHQSTTSKKL